MCNALGKEGVVTVLDFNEAVGPLVPLANEYWCSELLAQAHQKYISIKSEDFAKITT